MGLLILAILFHLWNENRLSTGVSDWDGVSEETSDDDWWDSVDSWVDGV